MYSSPVLSMRDRISFGGGITRDTLVLGVSPAYQQIRNLIVTDGRFLDQTDDDAHIKCAVVTQIFARERYGSATPPSARTSRSGHSLHHHRRLQRERSTTSANLKCRTKPSSSPTP